MEKKEFELLLKERMEQIGIDLNEFQIEQFYRYMNLLLKWNQNINLTAIVEPKEIILKHFIDSVMISKYLERKDNLIDVGTGAGFPGIPLKIVKPNIKITLLDSLNKRVLFLQEVIKELKLDNIEVFHGRAEEFGKNEKYREKFDIVTSRAVANLSTLSEYMLPFVKIKGYCICMKGAEIEEELDTAKNAIYILGGKIEKIDSFNLLNTDMKRNNLILIKEKSTPSKYPRKAGMPAKEPIK